MEHPFPSHRTALRSCQHGIDLLHDMNVVAAASAEDVRCIAERRDDDIGDVDVRDSVRRNASQLGTLVREVAAACAAADVSVPEAFTGLQSGWIAHITASSVDASLVSALRDASRPLTHALTTKRTTHADVEADDGSSSPSDYSDSETETTETRDEESEGEEEEESEEEEEPPRRRR